MPRLADLLPVSVNNSSDMGAEWLVNFAYLLGMDLCKAQAVYEKYGKGYIYAKSGFAMPDTPYQRRKMVANFGACVVVEANGETWVRTPQQIGSKNRKRAKRLDVRERHRIERAERGLMTSKKLERMFKDAQGEVCPKRGGKANSHSDIGKYVNNVHKVTMSDQERWSMPKLHIVRVNI